jgi:hypothetical protein
MKIMKGLSALMLGTAMCAGAAYADPPHHPDGGGQGDHDRGPPPSGPQGTAHGYPQLLQSPPSGSSSNVSGGHQNFTRFHGNGQNQVRFSHGLTFHDRNVAHFSAQDRTTWTGGHWSHGRHHGRDGWWWNAGGAWFFYDQPVYPYPGYASDYYYEDDYGPDYGAAPGDEYAPGPDSGYSWYYCNNPAGYYPYVQQCRGPWRPVQPTPPSGPQQQGYYDQGGPGMNTPDGPDDDQDDQGPPPPRSGLKGGPQGPGYDGPPSSYQGGPNGPYNDQDDQGPPPPPQHY